MKSQGYTLHPTQVGGTVKGSSSGGGPIQQSIYASITDTISNNTGPVGFAHNFVLSPSYTYSKGGTFRLIFRGVVSSTGSPTLRLQVYWTTGSNVLADSNVYTLTNVSNVQWQINAVIALDEVGNISDLGSIFHMPSSASFNGTNENLGSPGGTSFSGTGPIGLQVRWSAADPLNTITLTSALMDYYTPFLHA